MTTPPPAFSAPNVTVHYHAAAMQPAGGSEPVGGAAVPPALPGAPSGGSSSAPAPAPVDPMAGSPAAPISLNADPAYNAFLASLGLNTADLQNAAQLRAGLAQANAGPALAQNDLNTQDATQKAGAAFNGRGLYNSSDRLDAQGKIIAGGASRDAAIQNQLAAQLAAMYNSMGLSVAQAQARGAQEAQAAAGRQATQAALNGPNPFLAISSTAPAGTP